MLSRELGGRLTGRYTSIDLFSFSFKEFLSFTDIEVPEVVITEDRASIKSSSTSISRLAAYLKIIKVRPAWK